MTTEAEVREMLNVFAHENRPDVLDKLAKLIAKCSRCCDAHDVRVREATERVMGSHAGTLRKLAEQEKAEKSEADADILADFDLDECRDVFQHGKLHGHSVYVAVIARFIAEVEKLRAVRAKADHLVACIRPYDSVAERAVAILGALESYALARGGAVVPDPRDARIKELEDDLAKARHACMARRVELEDEQQKALAALGGLPGFDLEEQCKKRQAQLNTSRDWAEALRVNLEAAEGVRAETAAKLYGSKEELAKAVARETDLRARAGKLENLVALADAALVDHMPHYNHAFYNKACVAYREARAKVKLEALPADGPNYPPEQELAWCCSRLAGIKNKTSSPSDPSEKERLKARIEELEARAKVKS